MLVEQHIQTTSFSTSNNAFLMCAISGRHMQMIIPIMGFMSQILTGFLKLS